MISDRTSNLSGELKKLYYEKASDLLFHGWHHIYLTAKKAIEFSDEYPEVNKELLEAAALTHDLNYIVQKNSEPEVGKELRYQYLSNAGFN